VQQGETASDEGQCDEEDDADHEVDDVLRGDRVEVLHGETEAIEQPDSRVEVVLVARDEAVPEPERGAAQRRGDPGDRDRPRDGREHEVDHHDIQQVQPVVPVAEHRPQPAEEPGASAGVHPVRLGDLRAAGPAKQREIECSEAASDIESPDKENNAQEERHYRAGTRGEEADRDAEPHDRDRKGDEQVCEFARC
jgi:hypothetical protein